MSDFPKNSREIEEAFRGSYRLRVEAEDKNERLRKAAKDLIDFWRVADRSPQDWATLGQKIAELEKHL